MQWGWAPVTSLLNVTLPTTFTSADTWSALVSYHSSDSALYLSDGTADTSARVIGASTLRILGIKDKLAGRFFFAIGY